MVAVLGVMAVALVAIAVTAVVYAYQTTVRQADILLRHQERAAEAIEALLDRIQAPQEATLASIARRPVQGNGGLNHIIETPAGPITVSQKGD